MNKGFTLIELLVVVLIIGILAAIALPQYTKAVERSRAAEAFTVMSSLLTAERVYQLTEGNYTNSLPDLDIQFNQKGNDASTVGSVNSWDIQLGAPASDGITITATRTGGAYKNCGFSRHLNVNGSIDAIQAVGTGETCTEGFSIWQRGFTEQTAGTPAAAAGGGN